MYEWLNEDEIYWVVERVSDMIVTVFKNPILWIKSILNYDIGDKNEYCYDNTYGHWL